MSTTPRFSKLDQIYRTICLSKFFVKGWGDPDKLQRCLEFRPNFLTRESCASLINKDYQIIIDKEQTFGKTRVLDGHFLSPLAHHLPDIVKPPVDKAYFQIVLPVKWPSAPWGRCKPIVVQLAGTGDHFFNRRRILMANPLAKENGVGSILLENPFYGKRKPDEQKRSSLCNVIDLFIMGGCLILECLVLLDWCEHQGYGPLALHGVSMGGHMASLAAGSYMKPVALVPCLSWSTASCAFTKGVMSNSIPWSLLEQQYSAYRGLTRLFDDAESKAGAMHMHLQTPVMQSLSSQTLHSDEKNKTISVAFPSSITSVMNGKFHAFLNAYIWPLLYLKDRQRTLGNGSENAIARAGVVHHMQRVMDEFTHLANFPKPLDEDLIIAVIANHDAYLPQGSDASLSEIWPDAEIRHINLGHIGAFMFGQKIFRKAIVDALFRMATKYGTHKNV